MIRNFKHSASVEHYLSGEMLPGERELFEREVATNPELAEELQLSRMIDSALMHDDILDLRLKMVSVISDHKKSTRTVPVIRLHIRKVWYAAASLIILAAIGSSLYFSTPRGSSNEKLFNQYYTSENLVDITRSGDANIVEAVIKFQEKDYQLSARLFKNILEQDHTNMACWFYYGISCIESESYNNAVKAFSTIISNNENLYVEHAEWYLALTYLRNNQTSQAMKEFASIANDPDNVHQKDAVHLLSKLQ